MVESDPGPVARFEVVKAAAETVSVVFQRLADGETLGEIAKAWGVPRGRFTEWVMEHHGEMYDSALKVNADRIAHEALAISDEQQEVEKKDGTTYDPDVGRDKLRVDTRLKLAGKWDRARYGEHVQHQVGVRAVLRVDFSRPGERVVEPVVVEISESGKIPALGEI